MTAFWRDARTALAPVHSLIIIYSSLGGVRMFLESVGMQPAARATAADCITRFFGRRSRPRRGRPARARVIHVLFKLICMRKLLNFRRVVIKARRGAFCRFAVAVRAVVREDGAEAAAEGAVEDRDAHPREDRRPAAND